MIIQLDFCCQSSVYQIIYFFAMKHSKQQYLCKLLKSQFLSRMISYKVILADEARLVPLKGRSGIQYKLKKFNRKSSWTEIITKRAKFASFEGKLNITIRSPPVCKSITNPLPSMHASSCSILDASVAWFCSLQLFSKLKSSSSNVSSLR